MTTTPLSRRSALKMTGTAAALGAAAFSLSACTDNGTAEAAAEVDQLTAQADRARSDAQPQPPPSLSRRTSRHH